jgi:hypothetical protein
MRKEGGKITAVVLNSRVVGAGFCSKTREIPSSEYKGLVGVWEALIWTPAEVSFWKEVLQNFNI